MKINNIILLIWCVSHGTLYVRSAKIIVYEKEAGTTGDVGFPIEVSYNGECHNLPIDWHNRVSAVNTDGLCVHFYKELNCTGETIRLYAGNYGHHVLRTWNYDKTVKSIKPCSEHIGQTNYKSKGDSVTFFDEPDIGGRYFNLNVHSCRTLPENWRNRTSSIVTFTLCFVFYAGTGCTGRSLMIPSRYFKVESLLEVDFESQINSVDICTPNKTSDIIYTPYTETPTLNRNENTDTDINTETETENITTVSNSTIGDIKKGVKNETFILLYVAVPIIVLILLASVIVVALFIYFRKKNPQNADLMDEAQRELLCQKYVEEFLKGNPLAFEQISFEHADPMYKAKNVHYDAETFEIPLECIRIDAECLLGSGEFGIVSKAIVDCPDKFPNPIIVAVKQLKAGVDPDYIRAMLEELKVMMYLQRQQKPNKHPHIVNLIGACTEKIDELQPYIILEFCSGGSLFTYLRNHRKSFVNVLSKDPKDFTPDTNNLQINTLNLIDWSSQIANGMAFLSIHKVIHGDLATRNVLLDENLLAKISDFGLSKQLYHYSQYVKKKETPLPWRWMAIEALQDLTFSIKSDVWSYGITLWEIFSLAGVPYPGVVYTPEFVTKLKEGSRMDKPKYSSPELFDIMKSCWNNSHDARPSFAEILNNLAVVKENISTQVDWYLKPRIYVNQDVRLEVEDISLQQ